MRLPSTVLTSVAIRSSRRSRSVVSARTSSTCRSSAWLDLAMSRAATAGSATCEVMLRVRRVWVSAMWRT